MIVPRAPKGYPSAGECSILIPITPSEPTMILKRNKEYYSNKMISLINKEYSIYHIK